MVHLSLIVLRLLSTAGFDAVADSVEYRLLLRSPVTDTTPLFARALGSALTVQVRREADVHGVSGGWSVAVVRRGGGPEAFNLLYHSRAWHGPYPTDLFA